MTSSGTRSSTRTVALQNFALATGVLIVFLGIWYLIVRISGVHPIVLPSPARVLQVAWLEHEVLSRGFVVTGAAAICALLASVLVGSLIAMLFSQSSRLRIAFQPYVVFLQTVPIVAIAPLLITWFGYRFTTVILISTIISLFPIISNVTAV